MERVVLQAQEMEEMMAKRQYSPAETKKILSVDRRRKVCARLGRVPNEQDLIDDFLLEEAENQFAVPSADSQTPA